MTQLPARRPRVHWVRPALNAIFQRGLARAAEAPLIAGNGAELLIDGPAAYPAMLDLISSAGRRIHMENYIFRDDDAGRRFAAALGERARAGVEVRLLYDWLGSIATAAAFWDELRAAGCQVGCFAPPSLRRPLRIFRRNHRKLLVVDGHTAVVGGLCIGNEWTDGAGREACWRDTAVLLEGPVATELDRSFARVWRRAAGTAPALDTGRADEAGDLTVRVVDSPPFHARTYRLYQLMAALAEHTLYITGAYPLAPSPIRRALGSAARAGVDVRLLVPGRSDLPVVNHAARGHYASVLRAGVRVYEWTGPMLHAKTLVADGVVALVGSSNLNPFSLFGTYELDVEIQDAGLAGALESQFLTDLGRAREIKLSRWRHRPARQRWQERLAAAALWLPFKLFSG